MSRRRKRLVAVGGDQKGWPKKRALDFLAPQGSREVRLDQRLVDGGRFTVNEYIRS